MDKFTPQIDNINHSGNSNIPEGQREKPVNDFDNTPLTQAVEEKLITTPDTIADILEPREDTTAAPEVEAPTLIVDTYQPTIDTDSSSSVAEMPRSRITFPVRIGLAAAGIALAVGGFAGVKTIVDSTSPTPEPNDDKGTSEVAADPQPSEDQPAEVQPSNPAETGGELTVESIAIPAGLSPEQYGQAFFEKSLNEWAKAGATKENEDAWVKASDSSAFILNLANENAAKFAPALFKEGWENDENIRTFVENAITINRNYLELHFKTSLLGQEPYESSATANSTTVTTLDSGETVRVSAGTEYNNAANNKAGELSPELLALNNRNFTFTYTTEVSGGTEKVSSLEAR